MESNSTPSPSPSPSPSTLPPPPTTVFLPLLTPGLVGFTMSCFMYGIALGQYFHYCRAFPSDRKRVKYLVGLLIVIDTIHVYSSAALEWSILIPCRHNGSYMCFFTLTWQSITSLFISFLVPFAVQSFYAQRIWIISGKNKYLTGSIFFLTTAQIILGTALITLGATNTPLTTSTPVMLAGLLAAVVADVLISCSVWFYLRPGRFGIKRTETRIRHLTIVSINMGFLTCAVGIMSVIFVGKPQLGFGVSAAAMIIVKSHINSVLAVLNARKPTREGKAPAPYSTIQLPNMPTIELPEISNGPRHRTSRTIQLEERTREDI
ncbi:hypothetical protein BJ138DRAFT_1154250 [Hygrophoropsis aurantiaca]|uniref:Uncharacterized protein n=1 Tax=Hygrophoropsis aurantiaca TaxID=72124 RepID=A0ACB8A9C4_9AGAM|nr:hypothetical protein BJ138DRAFT_1154250 [Hygrophoropsis aurantiaca]